MKTLGKQSKMTVVVIIFFDSLQLYINKKLLNFKI